MAIQSKQNSWGTTKSYESLDAWIAFKAINEILMTIKKKSTYCILGVKCCKFSCQKEYQIIIARPWPGR